MEVQQKTLIVHGKELTVFYEIERFVNEVLIDEEYNPCLQECVLGDNLTIVDLGCNIGTFSFSMLHKSKQIYAIDFSINCMKLLKQTIEYNHIETIIPIETAVSGSNGMVYVTSIDCTDGGNSIYPDKQEYRVPSVTFTELRKQHGIGDIDILKIDVERAEDEIFSAPDFIESVEHIKYIIGECHNTEYLAILEKLGFKFILKPNRHFVAINTKYAST